MLVDGVIYRMPARRPTRDVYSYRGGGGGTAQYYYSQAQGYQYEREDPDGSPNYDPLAPRRRCQSSSTPQRPHTARPTNSPKKPPPTPKATEADARKHRIPLGYSLKNWDPTEEPLMLLGSYLTETRLASGFTTGLYIATAQLHKLLIWLGRYGCS